ncbi:MAG: HDOD domain-containing protein [Marinobacter sp.]
MPGLFSWITGFFSRASTATQKPALGNGSLHKGDPGSKGGSSSKTKAETHNTLAEALHQHLFCWLLDTRPQTLGAGLEDAEAMIEAMSKRLRAGKLSELPRQPMSLPMLMSALSDDTTTRQNLGNIILRDPALTDQLLKVANSPFFRPDTNTIETVDQAILMLGMNGIRSVVSAALMRPMISARNGEEATFSARTWRWGMACARAAETIARIQGKDASIYFMAGLLPALAYITLYREVHRLIPAAADGKLPKPKPAALHQILMHYQWPVARLIASTWGLSDRYQGLLHPPGSPRSSDDLTLTDGIVIGTREALRHGRQRNLAEEDLPALVQLNTSEIQRVQAALKPMLEDTEKAHAERD